VRNLDATREVGGEHDATSERDDEQEVAPRVLARDLGPQLAGANRQLLRGEI